jgi:outer membrane protein assembly factor BamB
MPLRHSLALCYVRSFSALLLFAVMFVLASTGHSQDVLTYHNNNARIGLNAAETTLTPTNVNSANFGKLLSLPADGRVDAQPLYLSAVTISGVTHNLLIVATEHGTVYAYDADTGANLWQVTTLKTGETPSDHRKCANIYPEIGITATPAIYRPKNANPVIYVVAMSKDSLGEYHQRLHALDATTGSELRNGPAEIEAEYPGTGDNASNGNVIFDPGQYKERAGLLLAGGKVYLAWASHCDYRPYTGWIMGYDINTLQQTTVLNLTPNGNEGAIWQSGAGMAADAAGNIFLLDGNGEFDTDLDASGLPIAGDFGNAFVRLTTAGGLAVADYFEPSNGPQESINDSDMGSGGTLLINQKDSTGKLWQLAVGAGKDSNLHIVDRTNMGKFSATKNNNYQELHGALHGGIWSAPAAFNGSIYYGPVGSPILRFVFQNAKLLATPAAKTANSFAYPGATPSISANGAVNGIAWATENTNPAVLHAYDARTLLELYNSNQAANARDQFGAGNKFITPTIANGKVYVGTTNSVAVFGLLPLK